MNFKSRIGVWTLLWMPLFLLLPGNQLLAQPEKVSALKQSMAENQKRLQQYQWTETTIVSLKGEEKSRIVKQCFYGPDGTVQKQEISAPPQEEKRGLRGKVVAKKKEELSDYMKQAIALIHQYVPPDSQRIQAAKDAGKISFTPGGGGVRLDIHDYLKAGDLLSLSLNGAASSLQGVMVKSYLDSPSDAISLDVNYASLPDGTNYPAQSTLKAPAKNLVVVVQNSNYQRK